MKEKLIRFMQGRYGLDSFSRCLLVIGLAAMAISSFGVGGTVGTAFYGISWVVIGYCYFRVLSRNIQKRYAENQAFLARTYKIRGLFRKQKNKLLELRTHHIYKCPNCKQKIRVPRGKGKIEIRCPKCGTTFIKKS